ncbi:MAG TPA: exodeoxyribonuclease VII small subunit [Eggerthellaceae bacterium]|nr:exodeoxyribonuclease VII small subunit [Eggerthellaceae bacterium]
MTNDVNTVNEETTFREAMAELNSIVAALESNTLELEESLVKYERGIALLRFLKDRLNNAQQKVDVLMGELDMSVDDTVTDSTLSKA